MAFYEIPLSSQPQTMTIALGGITYSLRFGFADTNDDGGGWFMDIADAAGVMLVAGIALVTGANLLAPYDYLGIPGRLWVVADDDPATVPTFLGLGTTSHLLFEPF